MSNLTNFEFVESVTLDITRKITYIGY